MFTGDFLFYHTVGRTSYFNEKAGGEKYEENACSNNRCYKKKNIHFIPSFHCELIFCFAIHKRVPLWKLSVSYFAELMVTLAGYEYLHSSYSSCVISSF